MLAVIDPNQPFQPEFQALVDDVVLCFRGTLQGNLHSVYVYGSVARKTARVGQSNLDVIVVTHDRFSEQRTSLLNTVKWRIQRQFPQVTGISVKTALVSEIATLDSLFTWGFLLKHCSVCVYGESLAECFGEYEPSWEIAKHWNMDLDDWLAVYRNKIARASDVVQQVQCQKVIARKILRASYSLVMHKDKRWFDDPLECGEQFVRYHPEKQLEIERLGILLSGRAIAKRSVIGLLDGFGDWLVKEYQKTEFRIG